MLFRRQLAPLDSGSTCLALQASAALTNGAARPIGWNNLISATETRRKRKWMERRECVSGLWAAPEWRASERAPPKATSARARSLVHLSVELAADDHNSGEPTQWRCHERSPETIHSWPPTGCACLGAPAQLGRQHRCPALRLAVRGRSSFSYCGSRSRSRSRVAKSTLAPAANGASERPVCSAIVGQDKLH